MGHTADVILEAWGPDLPTCCEEAVAALVTTFVEPTAGRRSGEVEVVVPAGAPESQLLRVLDHVVFVLDTSDDVPVAARVTSLQGNLQVVVELVDRAAVRPTGAVPKAVSRSELSVTTDDRGVRCRFLVDV